MNGIYVNKDEGKGCEWYSMSAESYPEAQNGLGDCYAKGIGTVKDEKMAFQLYLRSANSRNYQGQYNVGKCYHYGVGIEKDIKEAVNWYEKALYHGIENVKIELNELLSSGQLGQHRIDRIRSMLNK